MGKICKAFALIITLIVAMSCLTLLTAKSANAQAITVQPISSPVIIATPTPTPRPPPSPTPSPSPTPIPNVSLDYDEISKITEGNDTVVTLRITASYNFGNAMTYYYQHFVLDIRTPRGGLEPFPIYYLTGTAMPLETGSVTVGSNNRIADFTLTFRFSTIQNSFGGPIHFAYYELVYNSNAGSTATPEPTSTQALPVPEFSIKFVDGSYDVPVNTSIDPFTGKTITTPAQHINNQTIVLSIKNQIFNVELYYLIQMKGHFTQEWTNVTHNKANPHLDYTVVTYAVDGNNASSSFDSYLSQITSGGTVDFRIQAQIWKSSSNPYQMPIFWMDTSNWSPAQTITLTNGATSSSISTLPTSYQSPSPTSSPTPTVPEMSWVVMVPLLLSLFSVVMIVRDREAAYE